MSHLGLGEGCKMGESKNYRRKILTHYLCARYGNMYGETLQTRTKKWHNIHEYTFI